MLTPSEKFILDTERSSFIGRTYLEGEILKEMVRMVPRDFSDLEYAMIGVEYEEMMRQFFANHNMSLPEQQNTP